MIRAASRTLDCADQPERALLDQVEEGQALVAVVLGDRDDEAEVRLDHLLLGERIAALDPLRERDLLGGGQQVVPPGLAQEELQRIGGRLGRDGDQDRRRLGSGFGLGVDDLDPALVELACERVLLESRRARG